MYKNKANYLKILKNKKYIKITLFSKFHESTSHSLHHLRLFKIN